MPFSYPVLPLLDWRDAERALPGARRRPGPDDLPQRDRHRPKCGGDEPINLDPFSRPAAAAGAGPFAFDVAEAASTPAPWVASPCLANLRLAERPDQRDALMGGRKVRSNPGTLRAAYDASPSPVWG